MDHNGGGTNSRRRLQQRAAAPRTGRHPPRSRQRGSAQTMESNHGQQWQTCPANIGAIGQGWCRHKSSQHGPRGAPAVRDAGLPRHLWKHLVFSGPGNVVQNAAARGAESHGPQGAFMRKHTCQSPRCTKLHHLPMRRHNKHPPVRRRQHDALVHESAACNGWQGCTGCWQVQHAAAACCGHRWPKEGGGGPTTEMTVDAQGSHVWVAGGSRTCNEGAKGANQKRAGPQRDMQHAANAHNNWRQPPHRPLVAFLPLTMAGAAMLPEACIRLRLRAASVDIFAGEGSWNNLSVADTTQTAHLPALMLAGLPALPPRRPGPSDGRWRGPGQAGSWHRPVALFTTYPLFLHALHMLALLEQSAQRGSSQRRHTPLTGERLKQRAQRVRLGATNMHSWQSSPHARHVLAGARAYGGSLQWRLHAGRHGTEQATSATL